MLVAASPTWSGISIRLQTFLSWCARLQFDRQDKFFHLQLVIDGYNAIDRNVHHITRLQVLQGLKQICFHVNHVAADTSYDITKLCSLLEHDIQTTKANESLSDLMKRQTQIKFIIIFTDEA
jgi:hypothetical protein